MQRSNKSSKINDTRYKASQSNMTHKEFGSSDKWNDVTYFPQKKPLKVLGAIDDEIHSKDSVYVIGTVIQRGANVIHGGKSC